MDQPPSCLNPDTAVLNGITSNLMEFSNKTRHNGVKSNLCVRTPIKISNLPVHSPRAQVLHAAFLLMKPLQIK